MQIDRIPVISAMYFGPVDLYRSLAGHAAAIVDAGEHYQRQSHRNRMRIIGPNGPQDLVVPIVRRSGEKMPMHTVGISYAESWPQQHLHAIRSAYGKTPWYIHFADGIEQLLLARHERLIDLDIASMRMCIKWLGIVCELKVSDRYMEDPPIDLRDRFHPKKDLIQLKDRVPEYPQVFADRHGFAPRLSVLDLLCNCGPQATRYLLR